MKLWCLFRSHRRLLRKGKGGCICPKFSAEHIVEKHYVDDLKNRNWINKVAGK
jgi:hypothetical protein